MEKQNYRYENSSLICKDENLKQTSNSATSASAEEIFSDIIDIFNDENSTSYRFDVPIKTELLNAIVSLTEKTQKFSFTKWQHQYVTDIDIQDNNWINPKTGLCFKCGHRRHQAHCLYYSYHLFSNITTIQEGKILLDPPQDDEEVFDFKKAHRESKERRFERDVRYKNLARAGKIAKGPVQVLPDDKLYNFSKIPFQQIESWFPIGFNKKTKDGRTYEQYRRVCRHFYITNNWFFITLLGNRHGFVDIRDEKLVPKRKVSGKTFRVIYNGPTMTLQAQMMGVAGLKKVTDPLKNFVSSAYTSVTTLPETIATTKSAMAAHKIAVQGVDKFFETVNGGMESVLSIVEQIKMMFRQLNQFTKENSKYVYTLILDLGLMLSQVLLSSLKAAPAIAMFIGKYFGYDKTFDAFSDVVHILVNGIKGVRPLQAQSGLDLIPQMSATASIFGVLLGLVLKKETFDVTSAIKLVSDSSLWANRIFVQGRAAYASITDMFETYFDVALNWLGFAPVSPMGALQDDVDKFLAFVAKIKTADSLGRIYGDRVKLGEVEVKIKIGNELVESLAASSQKKKKEYLLVLRGVNYLEGWLKTFAGATAALIGSRQRPTCIMLQGRAGVGKSIFANILADDILEQVYGLNRFDPDYSVERMRYVWEYRSDVNDKDAYFNGLTKNHKVMIWSEAFQKKDRALDPSRDVQTLMACVDSAGYAPPQAFESKGKIPYEIPFIIITTNVKGHVMVDNQNWTSPHAINRRFDFIYWCLTDKKCKDKITGEIDISHIETNPDALNFHRVHLFKNKNTQGDELPISFKVDIAPTAYVTVVHDILERDAHYNKVHQQLTTVRPACSKTLNFDGKFLKVKPLDVTLKPLEMQMMAAPLKELGQKPLIPPVPKHKIELICTDYEDSTVMDFKTTVMDNLINHLHGVVRSKVLELLLDLPVAKFRFNSVHVSRDKSFLKFVCDGGSLIASVNIDELGEKIAQNTNLRADYAEFESVFTGTFSHIVDRDAAIMILWLIEHLVNSTKSKMSLIFDIHDQSHKKLSYAQNFKNYVKRQASALNFRWIAGVVAGVFTIVGAVSAYWFLSKKKDEVATSSITYLPMFQQDNDFKLDSDEKVHKLTAHLLHGQSSKVDNVPRTAKTANVMYRHTLSVKPQSNPLQDEFVKTKRIKRTDVLTPVYIQAAIEKVENMQFVNAKEGDLFKLDGDYSEFVAQSALRTVRTDPDGHAIRALVWQNTVCLFLCDESGKLLAKIGNALFVTNNVALMPKHYRINLQEKTRFCIYRMQGKKQWEGTIDECKITLGPDDQDIMSVKFPNTVCFPTILKHFVSESDIKRFTSIPAVLTTVAPQISIRDGKENVVLFIKEFHIMQVFANDEVIGYERGEIKMCNRRSYEYNCATEYGDCGAALTSIARDMPRKILGLHIAGNGDYCISVALTRELVNSLVPLSSQNGVLLAHHEVNPCICEDGCKLCSGTKLVCEVKDLYHGYKWFKDENGKFVVGNLNLFQGAGFNVGKSIYSGKHSATMIIEPSPLQGLVSWQAVKMPAHIVDHTLPDGTICHVKQEAFQKLVVDYKYLDPKLLDLCVADAMKCLYDVPDWKNYCRVLTIDEAVFGVEPTDPFLGCIKSLNLNSSCGKVWERLKRGNKIGKRTWIDLDRRWLAPELRRACELQMAEWEAGIRRLDPFSMESKSELRKPPKHLVPRMYNSGDMVSLINTKRLFAGVVALIQEHWLSTGVTVGMNCHKHFRVLCEKLQTRGWRVFDGDFKNFDGSLPVQLTERVMFYLIMFNRRGGFTDLQLKACNTADNSIRFAMLVALGCLILMGRGNPSGNFLTTQLNSFCVKGALRYVWMMLTKGTKYCSMRSYNENVVEVANGDDNVVNVSADASVFFNQQTVGEAFKKYLDMEYTDANKTGKFITVKTIDEITYLKRTMTGGDAGALDIESIMESVLWLKRGVSSFDAFDCTLSSALMEMFHHGKDKFVWFRNELERAMLGTSLNRINLKTYEEVYEDYIATGGVGFGFTY